MIAMPYDFPYKGNTHERNNIIMCVQMLWCTLYAGYVSNPDS